ncbi:MAG TPA: hypothetical protein VHM48_04495 [Candidatus Limnocylindrales bacterium]|nr:hypothetical protein [Candidatus Limnocylindrales bacterium]
MTVGTSRTSFRRIGALFLMGVVALAGCGGSGTPRPTDPRQILTNAIAATASLATLRLHAEIAANAGAALGQGNAVMRAAIDADVDLATRQFAARVTTQTPANLSGNGVAQQQVSDTIVTRDATFNRNGQTGRWTKFPTGNGGGLSGGPTNAQIATMITSLLSDPSQTFELKESASCTLGTCDHVIAHIDGPSLARALGGLLGAPLDASTGLTIPNLDVDVLVDQSTSVISELRTGFTMTGTSLQILVTISNPGQPVQIAPPPPALTDDLGANFGGGGFVGGGFATPMPIGPEESMILEQVGNELESSMPAEPEPSIP